MKKKYGLFKILTVLIMLITIVTWFIKGRNNSIEQLAIFDVFLNYIQSFYYFFDTAMFILVVGGFYGFLNRVPAYKKLVKNIANKVSKKSKLFIIITTIIFALLSSLTGLNLLLLLFIPFVISIILLLGYDKLVAISTTIGGTIVGLIGGIFVTVKQASNYAVSYVTFDKLVGLKTNWINLVPRILLLVIITGLLIFYIISYIKKLEKKEVSYKLTKSDNLFIEAKDRQGKVIEVNDSKTRTWPMIIVFLVLLIVLVLGYFPFESLFKVTCFNEFYSWITSLKIGDFYVVTSLISRSIPALGTWGELGSYMAAMVVLIVLMLIIKLIYRIKFEDAMDGFVYGVKKLIPAVMISMLAYCVLVCCYNNGFFEAIIANAGKEFGDNAIIHSLLTAVGSVLHGDLYYASSAVFAPIISSLTESANLSIYAIMFQSINGLIQLAGPTSIILIIGLSYLDVPYTTWLKYIWRFIIELIILILIVLMIVSLI